MLVGSIAPDAWRLMEGKSFRRVHFRSQRKVGERLGDFLTNYLQPAWFRGDAQEQGFWAGWLTHIVADGVWRRMLSVEMPELWAEAVGLRGDERFSLLARYQAACDRADRQLNIAREREVAEQRWLLRSVSQGYGVFPVDPSALSRWVTTVAEDLMPPAEPTAAGDPALDAEFVARAQQAALDEFLGVFRHQMEILSTHEEDWSPFADSSASL
jgi:hypothetical protein